MDILIRGNSDVTRGFAFLRYTDLQKRTLILNKFITTVITREIKVNFFLIDPVIGFFLFSPFFLSSSLLQGYRLVTSWQKNREKIRKVDRARLRLLDLHPLASFFFFPVLQRSDKNERYNNNNGCAIHWILSTYSVTWLSFQTYNSVDTSVT